MLGNYLLIALRHIFKNELYSSINILGLVVGLMVYLFGSMLADYEQTHDAFFKNSDRIYSIGSVFSPTADLGIRSVNSVHTALVALPLAYFATNTYLDFFPNRLSLPGAIILVAGCLGVALSGAVVSVHAMKVAYANPIHALRYE